MPTREALLGGAALFAASCFVGTMLELGRPTFADQRAPSSPSLQDRPDLMAAPGRGVQVTVSGHLAFAPTLFDLDAQPLEQISPLVQRQMLHGTQSTFVKWTVKKGGHFPLHHHLNEQVTWITKGSCEVYSQNRKFVVTAGRVIIIPPNTPHEFVCTEDTIDIDFFAPQRQDWIDGTPSVASEK